jgi:cell division protein FtsZ
LDEIIKNALKTRREDAQFDAEGVPRILVFGCGGAGNNTIDTLYHKGILGAELISINTDKQHLNARKADRKLLIGKELTRGLGAGGYPEIGQKSAEESRQELKSLIEGCDMIFISAGMGGGTGTGSAPVIAEIARDCGSIVIGVVTMPFKLEKARLYKAEKGLFNLRQVSDTVIVVDNNRLVKVAGNLPIAQAFAVADELIATMIKGIVETIAVPSLINLDFADVRATMKNGGVAMIGVGESNSEYRAEESVKKALSTPLLDVDYRGASGALVHISGGPDMTLDEANRIGDILTSELSEDAQVIWGARVAEEMKGFIRVMCIMTGVKSPFILGPVQQEKAEKKEKLSNLLDITLIK